MKYTRRCPYHDGFNDIYTVEGVDSEDYWARKRMLLDGDGGADPGGPASGDGADARAEAEARGEAAAYGGADARAEAEARGEAAAYADAQAEAEARAEAAAYAAQLELGFLVNAWNFGSPVDVTAKHDEFGRATYGLGASLPGLAGVALGGLPGLVASIAGPAIARGLGIEDTLNVDEKGHLSTGFSTPSSIESAVTGYVGVDTTPGAFGVDLSGGNVANAATGVTPGGNTTGSLGGVEESDDGIRGLMRYAGGDHALEGTSTAKATQIGQTLAETDLDPGGNAQPIGLPGTGVGTSGWNLVPTTRPLINPAQRFPVALQQPFFLRPNFQPFVRPMQYGGAVHNGIGSLLQIR